MHFWDALGLVPKMDDSNRVDEVVEERPVKRMRVGKPAGWADFKDDIYQLYAVKNYSIEELMEAMQKKGLQASYVHTSLPPLRCRLDLLTFLVIQPPHLHEAHYRMGLPEEDQTVRKGGHARN